MQEATIQHSLEQAREAFTDWYQLKQSDYSDPKEREDKAVEALLSLSDVISRASMTAFGDLLTEQEFKAVHHSLLLIRREEKDDVFRRSVHHAVQRLIENFSNINLPSKD